MLYASPTTYKVNIIDVTSGQTDNTTVWFLKDGKVVGLVINGINANASASGPSYYFQLYFSLWEKALGIGQQMETYASSSYFSSTAHSTEKIGPSTFTVTNYTASSLPETIPGCNGESITLNTGSFSVGTPIGGSSYPIVTYFDIAGSEITVGVSGTPSKTTFSFAGQMTSVTVA